MIVKVGDILVSKISGREFVVSQVIHNYGLLKESVAILSPILEPGFIGREIFFECGFLDFEYKFKLYPGVVKIV